MQDYIEKEIPIGEIDALLDQYDIEVQSPDGYVSVNYFINKGMYEEYILETNNGYTVRCNENHLFQTNNGWEYAKDLVGKNSMFLTVDGYSEGIVVHTGNLIPIVDINVDHENHRYYTNGVSSHNTGVGKSLFMCHCAASNLMKGLNVLYITLEMSEERIAERIDANLLNIAIDDLESIPRDVYEKKILKLREKTKGNLKIKEYPTASAGSSNFRHLLNELRIKNNFKPDIIYIDYLNICASSRIKMGASVNSYTYVKAIAEELRGLAVEFNLPIVSATQTTRSGYCLSPDSIVMTDAGELTLKDIRVGDKVLSNNGWNEVLRVFPKTKKKMFRITTESGESIIASEDHLFPTQSGEKNIRRGLCLEDKLYINKDNSLGDTNGLHLQNNKQSDE